MCFVNLIINSYLIPGTLLGTSHELLGLSVCSGLFELCNIHRLPEFSFLSPVIPCIAEWCKAESLLVRRYSKRHHLEK